MAENLTSKTKARKKVYCDVCNTFISSESLLPMHNNGKKHQGLLKARIERQNCTECSIYVRGFCHTGALESELCDYFCKFGNISDIFIDKEKTEYAIVQFDCSSVVRNILASKDLPLFNGKPLIIKQRSFKEHVTNKKQKESSPVSKIKIKSEVQLSHLLEEDVVAKMNQARTIEDQVQLLVTATCLTEDDNKLRKLIVQYLHEIFIEIFPECDIKLFGSSSTCLGLKGADLDLSLFVDPLSLENQVQQLNEDDSPPNCIADQLEFLVQVLKQFAAGFQNIVSVPSAKCPLIKCVHRDSGLSCDLSINNRLAIRNTELIKSYVALDCRIQLLAITLKNWGAAKQLTGSGGRQISNYSLVLMLLHFLQRTSPPVVPFLQNTFDENGHLTDVERIIIDGWDCSFAATKSANDDVNKQSVGDLLRGWFYYYSHTFDYGNQVITIQHKASVLKHSLTENIVQYPGKNTFKVSPLVIQDPFELSHNLTQNVSVEFLRQFIQSCMDAYSLLSPNSNLSSICERFPELFIRPVDYAGKPQKDVHFFTIPLLLSEMTDKESEIVQLQRTCEFVTNILTNDLHISSELQSVEPKHLTLATENTCENNYKKDKTSSSCVMQDINFPIRKRLREENETVEMFEVKKVKLNGSNEKDIVLLCNASNITWKNRRRQRRLQKQSDSVKSEYDTPADDMQVDKRNVKHHTKAIPGFSGELDESNSIESTWPSTSNRNTDNNILCDNEKPLLTFKLKLEIIDVPTSENKQCLITLYFVSGIIDHFSSFFAFFKKYTVNKVKNYTVN